MEPRASGHRRAGRAALHFGLDSGGVPSNGVGLRPTLVQRVRVEGTAIQVSHRVGSETDKVLNFIRLKYYF